MEKPAFLSDLEKPDLFSDEQFSSHVSIYRESYNRLMGVWDSFDSSEKIGYYNFCLLHYKFFTSLNKKPNILPESKVLKEIANTFGDLNSFVLKLSELADKGARWLIGTISNKKLTISLLYDNYQGIFGENLLFAIDLHPHAWSIDFTNVSSYLGELLSYIKWEELDKEYDSYLH